MGQGAVLSDRLYKLYNNSKLSEAQKSGLGVQVEDLTIAVIGQADYCVLVSSSLMYSIAIDNMFNWCLKKQGC